MEGIRWLGGKGSLHLNGITLGGERVADKQPAMPPMQLSLSWTMMFDHPLRKGGKVQLTRLNLPRGLRNINVGKIHSIDSVLVLSRGDDSAGAGNLCGTITHSEASPNIRSCPGPTLHQLRKDDNMHYVTILILFYDTYSFCTQQQTTTKDWNRC